ncbi:3'-5' exonuclease [Duncaniella dubosii]|uniref:3'-5' exonuclease n=1 Tax=Duncaniella dubosii TaxID=2518971 RepID=UPI0032B1F229
MENIKLAICKEALSALPIVHYRGGIMVVDTMDKARVALRELSRARVVGFDTETRPSFRKGRLHNVALMQLATDDYCFLFRLNVLGIFDGLKAFLENPSITKIGLSVHDDFSVMRRSADINPEGFVELQDYVKRYCIADTSLQKIYAIVFGECISKGQRLTNWEAPELTDNQQHYAALDAWACLRLYRYLGSGAFDPSESPYIVVPDESEALPATGE